MSGVPAALRLAFVVLAALLPWWTGCARAQGFFERSGIASPPPRLYGYQGARPYRQPYAWPVRRPSAPDWAENGDDGATEGPATTYRTLCVRLCDGFYFPISFAANGSSLSRDADRCSASCGAEARLFYHANPGGSVESMTDLTGLAYATLPNAFRYRQTLVEGCRCKPQPWSQAEQKRHQGYVASVSGDVKVDASARVSGAPPDAAAGAATVGRDGAAQPDASERAEPSTPWPGTLRRSQ